MKGAGFQRGVESVRLMAGLGRKYGLTMSSILAGAELLEADLSNPDRVISAEQELRVIRNLVEKIDREGLGLEAGALYHYSAFGMLGFAIVSSAHARAALELALKYFHLTYALTHFSVADVGSETMITIDASAVPPAQRRFVIERDVAAMVTVYRDVFSDIGLLKGMDFAFPAPKNLAPYRELFGFVPTFGAQKHCAFIRNDQIFPLPQSNEFASRAAEAQCERILMESEEKAGLAGRVRDRMLLPGGLNTDMEAVANELCMTPRTLRRQLQSEGVTFTHLRRRVAMSRACVFLTGSSQTVESIAVELGYASTTAFINTFKKTFKMTPSEYRRFHRAGGALGET
jgi:AraC-like DNA-binding protein